MALRGNPHDGRRARAHSFERLEQPSGILRGKAGNTEAEAPEFRPLRFEEPVRLAGRDEENVPGFQRPPSTLLHERRAPARARRTSWVHRLSKNGTCEDGNGTRF